MKIDANRTKEILQSFSLPETADVLEILQFGASALLREFSILEVDKYLGRKKHEQAEEFRGYRNGFRETNLDTPIGGVTYERQRMRGAADFTSKIHAPYMRRPEQMAEAVADMYAEGVNTRKVKRALKAIVGKQAKLSRSTVSRITQKLRDEFLIWKKRDLSHLKVAYLFLDAIRVGMRMGKSGKESVMVAYAVLEDGSMETLAIGLGPHEGDKVWEMFVMDLKNRGLQDPLLTVSDGNHGVIRAIEMFFPTGYRQRCAKHKMENVLNAFPVELQEEVKQKLQKIFFGSTSLEQAKSYVKSFQRDYKAYPHGLSILASDLDQAFTFYLFPAIHWRRLRTSNKLERLNLEIRRRLNSIGRHPDETGCLTLIQQVTTRYAKDTRGVSVTELVVALWKRLREQKKEMLTQLTLELCAS